MLFEIRKEGLLAIGVFSLIFSLLLYIFAGTMPLIDLFQGIFTGLSLTMNIAYLVKVRQEKNFEINQK